MFSAAFWRATTERAVRTVAQALLSLWLVGDGFDLLNVQWREALGVAFGAGVLSLLTSLGAVIASPATGPSLGTEKPLPVPAHRNQGGWVDVPAFTNRVTGITLFDDLTVTRAKPRRWWRRSEGGMTSWAAIALGIIVGGIVLWVLGLLVGRI